MENFGVVIFILIIFVIVVMALIAYDPEKGRLKRELESLESNNLERFMMEHQIPYYSPKYTYLSGIDGEIDKDSFVFVNGSGLNIILYKENTMGYKIPIDDIHFYTIKGDITQDMIKKDGQPVSTAGAFLTFGAMGAVIANQRNAALDPKLNITDQRITIIKANLNGKETFIVFDKPDLYNYLIKALPQKEQSFIM